MKVSFLGSLFILFLGFFGWKFFSVIEAIPQKKYSLFFLFCSLAYIFLELGEIIPLIPFIHQEIFEFLMSLGLFLNTFEIQKITKKRPDNPKLLFVTCK